MPDETIKALAVEIAMEDGSFQQGVKTLKQQLGVIDSEFKAGMTGAKNWGKTLDGLQSNATALGNKIGIQKKIVQQYAEQLKKSEELLSSNSKKMLDLKTKVDAARTAWEKSKTAIGANAEATKKLEEEYKKLNNQYESTESLVRKNQSTIQGYTIQLNNAKSALNGMEAKLAETNKEIETQSNKWLKASKSMEEAGQKFKETGDKLSSTGQTLTTRVTAPILALGAASATIATTFEDGMAKISTVADTTAISLVELGDKVVKLSDDTGQGVSDIQEGLYDAISAGVDTASSMEFMTTAVKAAKGGFTDTKTSVDGLTTTLNSYGLEATKATEIANQMMVAQNLGKTTFGEMASTMGDVVPITAALGVKTEELFSSFASLTANGIKTSNAVTSLKAAYSNILKPTADAEAAAKSLGLEFNATHMQSIGWTKFLEEVKAKTNGNTETMAQLFGSMEAVNAVLTLTSDQGMKVFNDSLSQMGSGTDYVNDAFEKVTNTSGQEFKKSLNELKNSGIELGNSLTPVIKEISGAFHSLAEFMKSMSPEQQKALVTLAGIAAATGPVIWGLGGTAKAIGSIVEVGGKATKALALARTATTAVGTASTVAAGVGTAGGMAGLGASFGAVAVAAAPWLLAGAAVVGTGYLVNKAMSKEAIPAVDLFADGVVKSAKKVKDANGNIITAERNKTVAISEGTKKAISAYMELDAAVSKALDNQYVTSTTITKQIVTDTVSQYEDMATQIKDGMDKRNQEQYAEMQAFFAKSKSLSETEEAEVLAKLKTSNEAKKKETDSDVKRIAEIMDKASQENRVRTLSEQQEIDEIREKMKTDAISALSEQELESKVILERMKSYGSRITAEQAGEVIKNANKQRDDVVSAAESQYEDTVRAIIKQRDETHSISTEQAAKLLADAEQQRADLVQKAEDLRTGVVNKLKEMHQGIADEVSDKDGSIKTGWSKLDEWFKNNPIFRTMYLREEAFNKYNNAGGVDQNWSGTDSYGGGLTSLHERGYELYDLPKGTRIYNHEASEALVQKTAERVARQVAAQKSIVNHTGTIRVEGVNSQGQLQGVVDIILDKLQMEARLA